MKTFSLVVDEPLRPIRGRILENKHRLIRSVARSNISPDSLSFGWQSSKGLIFIDTPGLGLKPVRVEHKPRSRCLEAELRVKA